ncbi:MAG TPA: 50S ribosomal protein L25 [Treponemataceae bacterium]|jgi:large subunit ribosomal protein L25|nr:MAG: 50S ribosomal protein L25 [Spirochaetes bacterium ADurb.Bin215]HOU38441.1 50S ribosomal protein L25 [Treponemataceae bacterium]HPA10368.1 50S ribosomal protein L25 [Treponemataceae bacterium]HQF72971.1 50S ribosomal protein L25 [Treponemataceae bacterium]
MNEKIIEARTRTMTGKGAAKRLRREGRLPAVMYDNTGKAVLLDLNAKDFAKLYGTITESTLIDVKIDGSKDAIAFVKDAQYNIITDTVTHVDFYEVEAGKKIRTKIPVRLTGSPEGVRTGGILEAGTEELDVECLPKNLPPRVVVDVSDLQLNHSIHVKDVVVPEGVKVLTDPHLTIATLKYAKADIPAAQQEATAEAAPDAPAAE